MHASWISSFAGSANPTFTRGGPDAKLYGVDDGYPVPGLFEAMLEGNP
jgi:hypothetical protein